MHCRRRGRPLPFGRPQRPGQADPHSPRIEKSGVTDEAKGEVKQRSSWRRDDWLGVAVFGAAGVTAALWLLDLGRNLTFFFDEWNFVEEAATTGYWHNVLRPHNGHPSMIPFSIYEALLHTVGLRHYWPYQVILVLLDIGCGWLLFLLLRMKVHPLVAGAVLRRLDAARAGMAGPPVAIPNRISRKRCRRARSAGPHRPGHPAC